EALKSELTDLGVNHGLRFILDFEKAAITAARKTFTNATVEGCGWHLAQAWTRKRNSLGLRPYILGRKKNKRVANWWNTIKGLLRSQGHEQKNSTLFVGVPFLPEEMVGRVPALYRPPVPRNDPAYMKCKEFLAYLSVNWLDGPFKGLWCKWQVTELRTTNLAEAFHSNLRKHLGRQADPKFRMLLERLRRSNLRGHFRLHRIEHVRNLRSQLRRNYYHAFTVPSRRTSASQER
ncbi:hypothetical protein OESDEN_20597, partial [Oesophagostomum dentatum]